MFRHRDQELVHDRLHWRVRAGQHAALSIHARRGTGADGPRVWWSASARPIRPHARSAAWSGCAVPARLRRLADDSPFESSASSRRWCRRDLGPAPADSSFRQTSRHDAHASLRTVRRSRPSRRDAQAVLETALVIPILLFLICNFIAVMVQVTVQQQLNSAHRAGRAVEVSGSRERGRCCWHALLWRKRRHARHRGTANRLPVCSGKLLRHDDHLHRPAPTGRPQRCAHRAATAAMPPRGPCRQSPIRDHPRMPRCRATSGRAKPVVSWFPGTSIARSIHRPDLMSSRAAASASLDFANTPLAWGVFWTPTLHAHSEALPPPFRQ